MKWNEMFKKAQFIDLSGLKQVSVNDALELGKIHVTGYSFCTTSNGETAITIFDEMPDSFFFAPTVLTNMFKQIDGNAEAKAKFDAEGITLEITKTKNKKGNREYFNFTPVD